MAWSVCLDERAFIDVGDDPSKLFVDSIFKDCTDKDCTDKESGIASLSAEAFYVVGGDYLGSSFWWVWALPRQPHWDSGL